MSHPVRGITTSQTNVGKQMEQDEFTEIFNVLRCEIDGLAGGSIMADGNLYYSDPTSFDKVTRRLITRSIFALFEAVVFQLKQDALNSEYSENLTIAEKILCTEQSFDLDSNGKARTKSARLQTTDNLKFAFSISARATGAKCKLNLSGRGWQDYKAGIKIRNRLMHPKSPADLEVDDTEIAIIMSSFHWFQTQLVKLLRAQSEATKAILIQVHKISGKEN